MHAQNKKKSRDWEENLQRVRVPTTYFTTGYHCIRKLPHITYYDNDEQMTGLKGARYAPTQLLAKAWGKTEDNHRKKKVKLKSTVGNFNSKVNIVIMVLGSLFFHIRIYIFSSYIQYYIFSSFSHHVSIYFYFICFEIEPVLSHNGQNGNIDIILTMDFSSRKSLFQIGSRMKWTQWKLDGKAKAQSFNQITATKCSALKCFRQV